MISPGETGVASSRRPAHLLLLLAIAGGLLHAAWIAGLGEGELDVLVDDWVYNAVICLSAVICLIRAAAGSASRATWACFGLGLLAWALGDIYWTIALAGLERVPYPSLADAGYLISYPFLYAGVLLYVRRRVRLTASTWLDGAVGGLAAAALATAILAPALVGLTRGDSAEVLTNLAYPLGDVLLLSFLIAGLAAGGVRSPAALCIGAGIAVWGVADAIYLYQDATGAYDGGYLDSLWLIGALLIAGASLLDDDRRVERVSTHPVVLPATFALVALAVLTWNHFERVSDVSAALAAATLAAVIARLILSARENLRLLASVEQKARIDPLTGLGNRRAMMEALERITANGEEVVLAIFDLDGFKAYNDGFGHPAGDLLLSRLGSRLTESVVPDGRAFRLGGDEFCVLVPGPGEAANGLVAAATDALSERGEGFEITASVGAAVLPGEARTPTEALGLADMRMYAMKGTRPNSAQRQTQDVLMRILREREPELGDHLEGVTWLALELGRALHLEGEELDVLARAAELHDVGKLAIPDRILHKAGPLDEAEWRLMRTHTTIGERILSAAPALAPVARLVRSSHERWDGRGYPDGLAGEQIPLGARIVSICDAFEAMTTRRPYRSARSAPEAVAEILRCAGTQFDPEAARVFAEEVYPLLAEARPVAGRSAVAAK